MNSALKGISDIQLMLGMHNKTHVNNKHFLHTSLSFQRHSFLAIKLTEPQFNIRWRFKFIIALKYKYFVKSYTETNSSRLRDQQDDIMQVTEQRLLSAGKHGN